MEDDLNSDEMSLCSSQPKAKRQRLKPLETFPNAATDSSRNNVPPRRMGVFVSFQNK